MKRSPGPDVVAANIILVSAFKQVHLSQPSLDEQNYDSGADAFNLLFFFFLTAASHSRCFFSSN